MTYEVTSSQKCGSRLKVCVIASTYPRYHDDYAVPWLRTSVSQMAARGHEVTILAPSFEGLRSHQIDGTDVVRFRYSPRRWERLTHEQGRRIGFAIRGIKYWQCPMSSMVVSSLVDWRSKLILTLSTPIGPFHTSPSDRLHQPFPRLHW